jgi:hypothetical protein
VQSRRRDSYIYTISGLAIATIWVCVVLASLFSPDMITGTQHDHMQMAFADYLWGAIATGAVGVTALAGIRSRETSRVPWTVLGIGVAATWVGVLLASVLAPTFVTGTDPTVLPLTVIGAPIFGVIVTGILCKFITEAVKTVAPAVTGEAMPQTMFLGAERDRLSTGSVTRLQDLARLRDTGVITNDEFEAKKTELLARI